MMKLNDIKLEFQRTGNADVDDAMGKLGEIMEPISKALESLEHTKENFFKTTGFSKEEKPSLVNAITGMVISLAVTLKGDLQSKFKFTKESPYLTVDITSSDSLDAFKALVKTLVDSKHCIDSGKEKVEKLAEEVQAKMKGMNVLDKLDATGKLTTKVTDILIKIKDLTLEVASDLGGIAGAIYEIKEALPKIAQTVYQCSEKSLTSPHDCFVEVFGSASSSPDFSKIRDVQTVGTQTIISLPDNLKGKIEIANINAAAANPYQKGKSESSSVFKKACKSIKTNCPDCKDEVDTVVQKKMTHFQWVFGTCLLFIPCCINSCYQHKHTCPKCKKSLGECKENSICCS